jgi:hypothetical protein
LSNYFTEPVLIANCSLRQVFPYPILHQENFSFDESCLNYLAPEKMGTSQFLPDKQKKDNNPHDKEWIPAIESILIYLLGLFFSLALRWNYKRE